MVESAVETVATGRTRHPPGEQDDQGQPQADGERPAAARRRHQSYRRRIPDPVRYVGSALRSAITANGIAIDGKKKIITGQVPKLAKPLAWRVSEPLATLVRGLGKYSNNFVAETLLKTLGAVKRPDQHEPATWDDGLVAVRAWLEGSIGWPKDSYYSATARACSSSNRFSPRAAHQPPGGRLSRLPLRARLPRLAVDRRRGRHARRRMSRGPAAGRVRAKTGTLSGVSTLSGYVALDGRAPLAFAILVNDIRDQQADSARVLQNEICEAMVPYLESGRR